MSLHRELEKAGSAASSRHRHHHLSRYVTDTFFAALIARYDLKWSKGGGRREKGFIRPLRSGLTISRARHSDGHMRRHLDREIAAAGRHSDESDN